MRLGLTGGVWAVSVHNRDAGVGSDVCQLLEETRFIAEEDLGECPVSGAPITSLR